MASVSFMGYPPSLTLIGWFPRTMAALLLLSDNHLLVAKRILPSTASSQRICSQRTVVIRPGIHMEQLLRTAPRSENGSPGQTLINRPPARSPGPGPPAADRPRSCGDPGWQSCGGCSDGLPRARWHRPGPSANSCSASSRS
jgi:hypothetical protein